MNASHNGLAEDAQQQMHAADTAQSLGEQHQAVLQIALAPAALALGVVNQ
jgi:hypothetical protein